MSNLLSCDESRLHKRPEHSGIIFTDTPSPDLLNKFTFALNANGHLRYHVNVEQLLSVSYIQIAYTPWGDFVGGSTIKCCDNTVAEMGYMLVAREYRRQGLAEGMTISRIRYARKTGIKILCAKVRKNNVNSIANLRKAGFQPVDEFLRQKYDLSAISWFYLPLQQLSYQECRNLLWEKLMSLTPVINAALSHQAL